MPAAPVRVLPLAAALGLALAAAWSSRGSIASVDWAPWAIPVVALVAVALLSGVAVRPGRAAVVAVAAAFGLASFGAISILWTPVPGLARDEALLVALYAAALLLPVLTLRSPVERLSGAAVVGGGIAALALATGARLATAGDAADLFRDSRLYFPISYANADAALFLVGFWPCVVAAGRRTFPLAVRTLALGGAGAVLAGALLAQSKGAVVGLVASALVLAALSPARLRLLVPAALACGVVAIWFQPLTEPFRAATLAELGAAVHGAGAAVLLVAAAAAGVGLAYALADRRLELSPRARRGVGLGALAALVAAVALGVAAFVVSVDSPTGFFADKWRSFKTMPARETAPTHLLTLGSNRYDFWRVALAEFADHPVAGVGARGFGAVYLQRGRSLEEPARAHSLALDVLMEEGVVGFALLAAAVGVPLALAGRLTRRRKLPATAALGGGVAFLAQAFVDWTWTFAAVGVPAFLLLGIALARDEPRFAPRGPAFAAGLAAVGLAVVAFGATWLSQSLARDALASPYDVAVADLERAATLDPVTIGPLLVRARIEPTPERSLALFREAAAREPRSVAAWYCVTVTSLEAGRRPAARAALRRLLELAPRERFVAQAALAVRTGGSAPSCRV